MLSLSFNELLPGKSVRVTADNMIYAIDLAMVVTEKNRDDAGKSLRNLSADIFQAGKFVKRDTGGRGNTKTRLVSFTDAIELIMILPGSTVKALRLQFVDIIKRYFAGDPRMARELDQNCKSQDPIHVMARQDTTKRRKLDNHNAQSQTHHVYATYSTAFPGLVKIGRSANVKSRLSSGNTFTAPGLWPAATRCPHKIIAVAPTFYPKRDEKLAHAHFAQFRRSGEFFEISHEDVSRFLYVNILSAYQKDLLGSTNERSESGLMIEWRDD